jgi:glycosyltransferase involved in cell wall biosynthesis
MGGGFVSSDAALRRPVDGRLPITVVVPVRNAEALVASCLASIAAQAPAEIVVVDGRSTDGTVALAAPYADRVLTDDGRGVAAARRLGAEAAASRFVAFVDVDVVLPPGSLARLLDEFLRGRYVGLQAGLESTSSGGYWGEALAAHHRTGRSRWWFGLVATIFERDAFLSFGLDDGFTSGEDIEMRVRLERAGARIGVSRETIVSHRFGGGWNFALGQWLADGAGLARTVRKHGPRTWWLLWLPVAGAVRGVGVSLGRREPQWLPYYLCYAVFNYVGFARGFAATPTADARPG